MSHSTTPATTSTSPISSSSRSVHANGGLAWTFSSLNLADYVGDDPLAVARNRDLAAARIGLSGADLAVMAAVHGADVAVVEGPGRFEGVDALVTQAAGVGLVALGADCVPLVLLGSDGVTCAVAHCGWRGLSTDVVGAVVGVMRDLGCEVASVIAGPAICGRCYPVPPVRAEDVRAHVSASVTHAAVVVTPDGQPGIDIRAGVVARLAELDVVDVTLIGGCTAEDPELFSYRRDGVTGRQGLVVGRIST